MVFLTDPANQGALSGMPHRMAGALRSQGVEVVPLWAGGPRVAKTDLLSRAVRRARGEFMGLLPDTTRGWLDDLLPERTRRQVLERGLRASARLGELIRDQELDLIFGVCISTALYGLRTDLPVVYFSDATSPIINGTYPRAASRGSSRKNALLEMERLSLTRVARAGFASPQTLSSALHDLHVPASRAHVIPMGAHITPSDPASVRMPADPPTARDCRLLIVASDPVRKRVDLAVRVTQTLRSRGINATLSVVGPGTRLSRRSVAVETVGPLRLSNPEDAQRHRELLRRCHIQLLPSIGEAFGIAPAESAHFARPSIVSDAGGLPFVVLDDRTGMVLPVGADHRAWADAVAGLVRDPERYRRYSSAALARAREELNWSAWGARMVALMREVVGRRTSATGSIALAG
jgi:glycosyltransferase involved in cell wall biosynthesis